MASSSSSSHMTSSNTSNTSNNQSNAYTTRLLARQNLITNTSGLSPGFLQANLLILPSRYAPDFHALCLRNPVPCPLFGIIPQGNPHTVSPAACITNPDFDLRTDFPQYRVYQSGRHIASRKDLKEVYTPDHVGFLLGCSFSFEDALCEAGLPPRHQLTGRLVAMYRTTVPLMPAGVFSDACMVVSMRPYLLADVEQVRQVTRPYGATHGEPVAWGWDGAERLGIKDIKTPDWGEAPVFEEGEVPVFWACGVTPQLAVEMAGEKIEGLVFAHEPGNMLVTDWTAGDLEALRDKSGIALPVEL
ncbi:hypothetical protein KXW73_000200 [Aspergillus fumigatus]|nr:hypothetical protein KXW73_000200 [Aspergillus fumigatus]